MTIYYIGFKNGERIKIKVADGVELVNRVVSGVEKMPNAQTQWYCEPGLMLNVSEVCFVLPESSFAEIT